MRTGADLRRTAEGSSSQRGFYQSKPDRYIKVEFLATDDMDRSPWPPSQSPTCSSSSILRHIGSRRRNRTCCPPSRSTTSSPGGSTCSPAHRYSCRHTRSHPCAGTHRLSDKHGARRANGVAEAARRGPAFSKSLVVGPEAKTLAEHTPLLKHRPMIDVY